MKEFPTKFSLLKEERIDNEDVLVFEENWEDLFSEAKGLIYLDKKML